jgi:hypothetical protein
MAAQRTFADTPPIQDPANSPHRREETLAAVRARNRLTVR